MNATGPRAALVHLHVRKEQYFTQEAAVFKAAIERIRAKCDIIVQTSTGGAVGMSAEERLQPVYLKPEMASPDHGDGQFWRRCLLKPAGCWRSSPTMQEQGSGRDRGFFEVGMINNARYLARKGLIEEPMHYDFVMGSPAGFRPT